MKRLFIVLILTLYTQVPIAMGNPQIGEKYTVHEGEKIFYLLMPVSEVYNILGTPDEIRTVGPVSQYKNWNIITLVYPGIIFRYFDFYDDPKIYVIALTGTEKEYQIGRLRVMGFTRDDILEEHGNPEYIMPRNEYVYYFYEIFPDGGGIEYMELQFRLNSDGICNEVILIHSGYYV